MSDKEQQIDEMIKIIIGAIPETNIVDGIAPANEEEARKEAEALYNAGYRKGKIISYQAMFDSRLAELEEKLENGELVSKDWHDEQVFIIKGELDKTHENYVAVLKHNAYLRNELRESKAEAVKEFAEKLKSQIHKCDYVNGYAELGLCEEIDELLKEYEK